jgi:Mce-associated membrane protein
VSVGDVLEAGIVTSDSDSARVLVVVDSKVTNTATTGSQVRHYRMQLDLTRRGDRWLTSDLSFVS